MRITPPAVAIVPGLLASLRAAGCPTGRTLSPRLVASLLAGLGCGACGLAGIYPRLLDGLGARLAVGTTCAAFGAAVVAASLSAQTRAGAFLRAVGFSALLSLGCLVLPAAELAHDPFGMVGLMLIGAFFAVPTGIAYGMALGTLVSLVYPDVKLATHESADRAVRRAALWTLGPVLLAGLVAAGVDRLGQPETNEPLLRAAIGEGSPTMSGAVLALAVAAVAALVAIGLVTHAALRLRARRDWLARVAEGREPAFRLRRADDHELTVLPRLGYGRLVLETVPDAGKDVAYRVAPGVGEPVALVSDDVEAGFSGGSVEAASVCSR